LRAPNRSLPFHISSDASDTSNGVALGKEEDKKPYIIYFFSKNLSPGELNYTVTEKDFFVVIFSINKLTHYIIRYEVFVHTNHSTIR